MLAAPTGWLIDKTFPRAVYQTFGALSLGRAPPTGLLVDKTFPRVVYQTCGALSSGCALPLVSLLHSSFVAMYTAYETVCTSSLPAPALSVSP